MDEYHSLLKGSQRIYGQAVPDHADAPQPVHETTPGMMLADWLEEHPEHPDAYRAPMYRNLIAHEIEGNHERRYASYDSEGKSFTPSINHREINHFGGDNDPDEYLEAGHGPNGEPLLHYTVVRTTPEDIHLHRAVLTPDQMHEIASKAPATAGVRRLVDEAADSFPATHRVDPLTREYPKPTVHKLARTADGDAAYKAYKLARKKTETVERENTLTPAQQRHHDYVVRKAIAPYGLAGAHPKVLANYSRVAGSLALRGKTPAHMAYVEHLKRTSDGTAGSKQRIDAGVDLMHQAGLLPDADLALQSEKAAAHQSLLPRIDKPEERKPSGFVELPNHEAGEPRGPYVQRSLDELFPGAIQPAGDQMIKPPYGLGAKATGRRVMDRLRGEAKRTAANATTVDDAAPLPLASTPLDAAVKDTNREAHRKIAEMTLRGMKKDAVIAAILGIKDEAGNLAFSHDRAKRLYGQWVSHTRDGLRASGERPEKLARKGQAEKGVSMTKTDLSSKVHPLLAGTRLAAHLIQIAKEHAPVETVKAGDHEKYEKDFPGVKKLKADQRGMRPDADIHALALHALHGTTPHPQADVFAMLGDRLNRTGSRFAKLYNWGHERNDSGVRKPGIGQRLKELQFVKEFVDKHVRRPEGMGDREFYMRVLRDYGGDARSAGTWASRAAADAGMDARHDKFWGRLGAEWNDRPHLTATGKFGESVKQKLADALYRLHSLADDRDTIANLDTKPKGEEGGWRHQATLPFNTSTVGGVVGDKRLKFAREPEATDAR